MIRAPGIRTGTPNGILSYADKEYVGAAIPNSNKQSCQQSCQKEEQCNSMTFYGPGNPYNKNLCILNFGETDLKITAPAVLFAVSAPKVCPEGK